MHLPVFGQLGLVEGWDSLLWAGKSGAELGVKERGAAIVGYPVGMVSAECLRLQVGFLSVVQL